MSAADLPRKYLRLRLFGTWQACLGETPLPPLRSRKGEWLLALLVLRGDAVSRSWLAGTLWPESDESRALLYLRRELTYLRKALGKEGAPLLAVGRTLHLDLANVDCDLLAFDAAIARADEASLEVAVSLYGGSLLAGCSEVWVTLDREAREQAYLAALERLAELALARGDIPAAIRRLRAVIALDPLRESAQRSLMKALAEAGDAAAAVQVYRDLRLYLRREMNAEVAPETNALFHQIRTQPQRSNPSVALAARKDNERGLPRIPVPLTRLIGREQEVGEVRRRLETSRLLTLTGTGGVGKTRLAIEIAREIENDFEDGVCFVELATLSDATLVPQSVMDALGLKPDSLRTPLETLAARLGGSDLLLILDNCEHLIRLCAEMAGSLLRLCPHLRILTTSRESLGIVGEAVWRVPPLATPPETNSFRRITKDRLAGGWEYEAVVLFVERAQQARADFTLASDNVETVAQICRQLDGIPLAIELAAARVRSLSVEDIASRLDQRFSLLTRGVRTGLPRHQTLYSLIDWSYDLLNESERALFCRLAVFNGGWTLEAAEQVCAGDPVESPEVLDLLTSLADKSLVVAETDGSSVRFRLLETMRQYAQNRLVDGNERERWCERHLAYFLTLAEQAETHLMGPEQQQRFGQLESDYDNLRAALEQSVELRSEPGSGLRLCSALWWFWHVRGRYIEGRQWCERVLVNAESSSRSKARADVLHGAAVMNRLLGDYAAARAHFAESLSIRREIGDRRGIACSLHGLGFVAHEQGATLTARALLDESLLLHQETGNQWGVALVLNRLGFLAHEQSDYPTAQTLYETGLSLRREAGDRWGIAHSLNNLGCLAYDRGDYSAAQAFHEASLAIKREIDDRTGIAEALINLGNITCQQGNLSRARTALSEGTLVARNAGDRYRTFEALEAWGSLAVAEKEWKRAVVLLGAAESLREQIGSPLPQYRQPRYHAQVSAIRASIGKQSAFDLLWQEGREMTTEQAVDFALKGAEG